MNVQEELKALKQRISELEQQVKQEQTFPQNGDKYWYIDDEGEVFGTFYDNHYIDRYHQEIGNIFQTKEQAEFAVEKLKVEAELRKFSRPFKPLSNNYVVISSSRGDMGIKNVAFVNHQGSIHFESEEKAQEAVNTVGENRIKKYIFGLEG